MQKLVDARWAKPHCYGDLPYRQASPMCRCDGDVSIHFSRFEPVRDEAKAIAYGPLPLNVLARSFRSVHRLSGCQTPTGMSTKLDALP